MPGLFVVRGGPPAAFFFCRVAASGTSLAIMRLRWRSQALGARLFPSQAAATYMQLLRTHPNTTGIATGGLLALIGDVFCQTVVEGNSLGYLDGRRCAAMTAFGSFYTGFLALKVFSLYPRILPRKISAVPLHAGIASSMLDNFIHTPFLYTPTFYLSTEVFQGRSVGEAWDKFREQAVPTITACWIMWIPLQTLNFGFVPVHAQVVVLNCGCLVWNVILDFIANRKNDDALLQRTAADTCTTAEIH